MNDQNRITNYGNQEYKKLCPGFTYRNRKPHCNLIKSRPTKWCKSCPVPEQMKQIESEAPFSMQVCYNRDMNNSRCDICTTKKAGKDKSCFKPHRISLVGRLRRKKGKRYKRSLAKQKLVIETFNENIEAAERRKKHEP